MNALLWKNVKSIENRVTYAKLGFKWQPYGDSDFSVLRLYQRDVLVDAEEAANGIPLDIQWRNTALKRLSVVDLVDPGEALACEGVLVAVKEPFRTESIERHLGLIKRRVPTHARNYLTFTASSTKFLLELAPLGEVDSENLVQWCYSWCYGACIFLNDSAISSALAFPWPELVDKHGSIQEDRLAELVCSRQGSVIYTVGALAREGPSIVICSPEDRMNRLLKRLNAVHHGIDTPLPW